MCILIQKHKKTKSLGKKHIPAFDSELGTSINESISNNDFFEYGVVARVVQIHKDLMGKFVVTLEGFVRCKVLEFKRSGEILTVNTQIFGEPGTNKITKI
jgi:Lon protease-like protein